MIFKTGNGIISSTSRPLIRKLLLQKISHFHQGVPKLIFKTFNRILTWFDIFGPMWTWSRILTWFDLFWPIWTFSRILTWIDIFWPMWSFSRILTSFELFNLCGPLAEFWLNLTYLDLSWPILISLNLSSLILTSLDLFCTYLDLSSNIFTNLDLYWPKLTYLDLQESFAAYAGSWLFYEFFFSSSLSFCCQAQFQFQLVPVTV